MSNDDKCLLISKVCSTNLLRKIDLLPLIISKSFLTATKSQEERIFARQHLVENFLTNLRSSNSGFLKLEWPLKKHWYNLLKSHDRSFGDEVINQISKSPNPFVIYQERELLKTLLSINFFKTNVVKLLSNFLLNSGPESFESTANSTLSILNDSNLEKANLWIFTDLFWFFGLYSKQFRNAKFDGNYIHAKLKSFADRQLSGTDTVSQFHRMRISLVVNNPDLLMAPSNCKTLMDSIHARFLIDQVMAMMWAAKVSSNF